MEQLNTLTVGNLYTVVLLRIMPMLILIISLVVITEIVQRMFFKGLRKKMNQTTDTTSVTKETIDVKANSISGSELLNYCSDFILKIVIVLFAILSIIYAVF